MEEIKAKKNLTLNLLPRIRKNPRRETALAFAALAVGGWAAMWSVELLFRLLGVA